MKKKKIIALLTACMLMTGMLAGCGSSQQAAVASGTEAGQTQTGADSLFNEPGQLPLVNEPVTLTVFAPANPDGSWEDNEMVKELEEATGIHLEWQTCAASDNRLKVRSVPALPAPVLLLYHNGCCCLHQLK